MTDSEHRPEGAGNLQVVARAAQILRMFDVQRAELRINDVADELEIGRTSAHRYLQSMAVEGMLQRVGDGSYRLGPLLTGLGATMLSSTRAVEIADPFLRQLAEACGETTVLGIWTGANAVAVLCKEPPGKTVNMTVRIGAALRADSAQGLCFLSYLDDEAVLARSLRGTDLDRETFLNRIAETTQRGYAVSDAVLPGIGAIAAPVFDGTGTVAATVAIVAPLETLRGDRLAALATPLIATANTISHQLGHTPK